MKYRRPRYMNDGGIASLLSNGGSEAMMLDLESAPNWAQKVHTNIVGGEWDDELDLLEDFTLAIPRAADAAVDPFLDFMDAYDELKDETEATAEDMFDMQGTYEEEEQRQGFSSLSSEQQELIAESLMPGAGIVKTTKMGLKTLDQLKKTLADKAKSMKSSSKINVEREIDPKTGFRHDVPKDATTHLKQSISKTKKLPPEMRYGGALSYKKGYYGKSYK